MGLKFFLVPVKRYGPSPTIRGASFYGQPDILERVSRSPDIEDGIGVQLVFSVLPQSDIQGNVILT